MVSHARRGISTNAAWQKHVSDGPARLWHSGLVLAAEEEEDEEEEAKGSAA